MQRRAVAGGQEEQQEQPPQPQPQLATLETKPKPAGHGRSVWKGADWHNVALCSFSLKQFLKHFSTLQRLAG